MSETAPLLASPADLSRTPHPTPEHLIGAQGGSYPGVALPTDCDEAGRPGFPPPARAWREVFERLVEGLRTQENCSLT